jgi:hypothetical protein
LLAVAGQHRFPRRHVPKSGFPVAASEATQADVDSTMYRKPGTLLICAPRSISTT